MFSRQKIILGGSYSQKLQPPGGSHVWVHLIFAAKTSQLLRILIKSNRVSLQHTRAENYQLRGEIFGWELPKLLPG